MVPPPIDPGKPGYFFKHEVSAMSNNLQLQQNQLPTIITLDKSIHQVYSKDKSVRVRTKFNLVLQYLFNNPNRVVLRSELVEHIWKGNQYTGQQGITHTICHVRKIIRSLAGDNIRIETIPKRGYRLSYNNNLVLLKVI